MGKRKRESCGERDPTSRGAVASFSFISLSIVIHICSNLAPISSKKPEIMAATLSFLQLPLLPHRYQQQVSSKITIPTNPISTAHAQLSSGHSKHSQKLFEETIHHLKSVSLPIGAFALPLFLDSEDALAVGGEFGILEGRTVALIHPLVMTGLFFFTLYAGYLGWQWRRVRTIQNEISELKKQVKPVPVTPDGSSAPAERPKPSPIEVKIQQLTEERKELIKGQYRDKHFDAGSILLGFGVLESVFGGLNTWLRTGKLFPGPHLFGGAAITVLWAAAAALVPPMQKGNETARNLHIALNAVNVILFAYQIPTGIDIVFKVFEFTKWP